MKLVPTRKGWRVVMALLLALSLLLVLSCSTLGYYGQAAWGQTRILLARRGIDRLVRDPATPEDLRAKLGAALAIRDFAVAELRLPDNGSYRSYVELPSADDGSRRRAVVWNVVAAPELSTAPLTWCFPVAGCVSYRGYFSRKRATSFAEKLDVKGYDVAVGGASAYSTLGWFKDPILSTVIDDRDVDLAGFLFHELAHQLIYVKDDTRFNESFATAVEIEGVRRWLAATGREASAMDDYLARMRREEEFVELVLGYRDRLEEAYGRDAPAQWKKDEKSRIFEDLKRAYEEMKADAWSGDASYDGWFARELNNAHLVSVGAYHDFVPGFRALLDEQGSDLGRFYAAVRELADASVEERERRLLEPADPAE